MRGLICEEGLFSYGASSKYLARHIFTRMWCGKIVIVADNPVATLSPLRKQWLKLIRKIQLEQAKTLKPSRVYELTQMVIRMQNMRFTTQYPPDEYSGDVYIATLEQALKWAPDCRTLYITCEIKRKDLYVITAWMREGSTVVC